MQRFWRANHSGVMAVSKIGGGGLRGAVKLPPRLTGRFCFHKARRKTFEVVRISCSPLE